MFCIICISIWW